MDIGRPSSKAQPSRKGKKAWRKNVDIDDVEQGLAEAREMERSVGLKSLEGADQDDIFTVDTAGDETLKPKKMRETKPLKATEILARRSAVPALPASHKKLDQPKPKAKGIEGVSGKEINRLMQAAGRVVGKSSAKAQKDGDKSNDKDTYDIWGGEEDSSSTTNARQRPSSAKKHDNVKKSKGMKDYEFLSELKPQTSFNKATVKPETLSRAPISFLGDDISKAIAVPEAGKSYNPDEEEWLALLKKEHEREKIREDEKLRLEAEKERIEELMRTLPDEEVAEDSEESEGEDQEKQDGSGDMLSINAPVKVKTKTKQQRSRQKRHQQQLELQKQIKDLKQQIRDLNNLPKLIKEEMARLERQNAEAEQKSQTSQKRKKKLGKHHIKEAPLEIKLSDELTSTLRRLKPEGDMTTERFRSLQERGLIEARVPVAKRRRYTPKITEKWSFKDYK